MSQLDAIFGELQRYGGFLSTTYFDQASRGYSSSCESGVHGYFKKHELDGLRKSILKYYPEPFEGKIVDIGCGSGFYSKALREIYKNLHFTGVDSSAGMIEEYRKLGLRGVSKSVEELANQSIEFFDILLALGVLEFVSDENEFVRAIRVISRNESRVFVVVPRISLINLGYFIHHKLKNNINIRTRSRYIRVFDQHGFECIESKKLTSISELLVFKVKDGG